MNIDVTQLQQCCDDVGTGKCELEGMDGDIKELNLIFRDGKSIND